MTERDDDSTRSTTAPDTAPQTETENAEPGTRPAVKDERQHGPHDETEPWADDDTAPPNPRQVPGNEETREA